MSKYEHAAPRELLDHHAAGASAFRDPTSSVEEIAVLDARTAQLLSALRDSSPTDRTRGASALLDELECEVLGDSSRTGGSYSTISVDGVASLIDGLRAELDSAAASARAWEEIRRNLEVRDKLARTELARQKAAADRMLVEHVEGFVAIVASEARALTSDPKKLAAFADGVAAAARAMLARPTASLGAGAEELGP